MTICEIQDIRVNTARGLERLESPLEIRSQLFRERTIQDSQVVERLPIERQLSFVGIRLTATPVADGVSIRPRFS